ncbi:MAG TPA: PfkB family carbohydrate kinase, partial [Galbitalea sp.]
SLGVLVRLGADGCLVGVDGRVEHIPGYPVDAVDTNGAGDAHCGAFLAALAAGLTPTDAAARANACAAIAITRRGPATAPTLAEVDAFLGS